MFEHVGIPGDTKGAGGTGGEDGRHMSRRVPEPVNGHHHANAMQPARLMQLLPNLHVEPPPHMESWTDGRVPAVNLRAASAAGEATPSSRPWRGKLPGNVTKPSPQGTGRKLWLGPRSRASHAAPSSFRRWRAHELVVLRVCVSAVVSPTVLHHDRHSSVVLLPASGT